MQRDILFFVRGIPKIFHVQGKDHFFMAVVSPALEAKMQEQTNQIPRLKAFFQMRSESQLLIIGFRNDCDTESLAIDKAWKALSGIIDGLSFILESDLPEVCGVVQIREGNSEDVHLTVYADSGWAHFHPGSPTSIALWQNRQEKLLKRLLVLFDITSALQTRFQNDLCYQLIYSSKMFRCGIASKNFGVEYLCKFSALEGLVCGSEQHNKENLLKRRLDALFARSGRDVAKDTQRIWKLRCEASHQAKAFHDEEIPGSVPLATEIVLVEYFLTGAFVFALDQIETTTSVDQLWSGRLSSYSLPEYALLERPNEMPKLPIQSVCMPLGAVIRGVGRVIDAQYSVQAVAPSQ